jgi:hypothetical protein
VTWRISRSGACRYHRAVAVVDRRVAVAMAVLVTAVAARVRADGETVANVEQLVEPLSRLDLRLDLGVATSWPQRGSRAALSLEIATRPDFWYSVGVTTAPAGSGDVVTTTDGSGVTSEQLTAASTGVALSARIFKRIGPVVGSAGLIENHGGVSLELRGLADRLRLEALVSSPSLSALLGPPHLRVGGSAQWRWLYVQAGGQDLLDPATRAAYLGVGMRWSDPDLGALLPWVRR